METFLKLFGNVLAFVYHCFDRIVIQGYIPLLAREAHIVHFFRDLHGVRPITTDVLRKRTDEYRKWVDSYASNHKVPMLWPEKGMKKEDLVRPYLDAMVKKGRYGAYAIVSSMEKGPCFDPCMPKFPTDDPDYRIIRRKQRMYTHLYFYIRDEVVGPMVMCVGTYVPFQTTYYLNGHFWIENQLKEKGIAFRKDDNAFLSVADPAALQAAADSLTAAVIRKRLDRWTFLLGPKFSPAERAAVNLSRDYSINQVEYCRNFIFRSHAPIHKIFERSCETGLFNLTADKVSQIFGFQKTKRWKGKLYTLLEKIDHGHHVLRAYARNSVARMYEKFTTFLRLEICVNRVKDFGLNKGLDNLAKLREKLKVVSDRFAEFEAQALNIHVDLPLFQQTALPVTVGNSKVAGIKIQDTRMLRLMEVLLHHGTQVQGRRTAEVHQTIVGQFNLEPDQYTLNQLRYDMRKMKAHGLVLREEHSYRYRLTEKGMRVALMFVLFHKRVCGPAAFSLFDRRPNQAHQPASKIEKAYYKVDAAIDGVLKELGMAA